MSGKRDCLDLLARSVAPSISGSLEVKKVHWCHTVWGWQGWHRQYNELRGDRLKKRRHLSEFSISPCKLDFWQIWRTLSYFQSGLTLIPPTSTVKYCSVCYDKFWSGHNDSVRGLPLRESCWCWWVKCSDFPGRNSAHQLGCINPGALPITVQDEELSEIPKCFFDSSRWREEVHHGRDSAERRHQCLSVTWLKKTGSAACGPHAWRYWRVKQSQMIVKGG